MGFLLPLLVNRYTVGAAIAIGLLLGAYWKGYSTAAGRCHEAELRAKIATMERDLAAWKAADEVEKMLQADLDKQNRELQQLVVDYEKELLLRPAPACRLTPDDVRALERVRGWGKGGPAR